MITGIHKGLDENLWQNAVCGFAIDVITLLGF